jgi:hypothetical protein
MRTFAWQIENRKSARQMEMVNVSKDAQNKTVKTKDMAGNSSKAGPNAAENLSTPGAGTEGNSFKAGPSTAGNSTSKVSQNRKKKVYESLKVVGIILLLLVLLTGPSVVLMFMTAFNFEPPSNLIPVTAGLSFFNSMLNPLVYGWRIDPLKEEIKTLFRMRRQE